MKCLPIDLFLLQLVVGGDWRCYYDWTKFSKCDQIFNYVMLSNFGTVGLIFCVIQGTCLLLSTLYGFIIIKTYSTKDMEM